MNDVHIIGVGATRFARHPERDHTDLVREAVGAALADAHADIRPEAVVFGSCAMHLFGQPNVRGQVALRPLVDEGLLPAGLAVTNVEAGCATGALAVHTLALAIAAGELDIGVAVGVDKTFVPHDPAQMRALFEGALDQLDPSWWQQDCAREAARYGLSWAPHPARITLLDVCALAVERHMQRYGTTSAQIAASAAKNHSHAVHNERAQYRTAMTVAEVLADKAVVGPLTRAMCAPISDGAAAAVLCSSRALRALGGAVAERAVTLVASGVAGGRRRDLDDVPVSARAAEKAYDRAGLGPDAIDCAEVHDATSFAELAASESLGFCRQGEGGAYIASGAATLGGRRPANTSGGLVSKGHPLAASGIAMLHELCCQLRGEAGARQVDGADVALLHNAGGLIGVDEALAVVQIARRSAALR
jgi:acetyl-CoA acetyltransferase